MSMLSNQPVICPIKLCNPDFNNRAGQGGGVGGRWRMQEESEEDWLRVNPASFIHIYDGIFELFHLFSLYVRLFWFFISPTIFKYVCCGRINRCLFNLHRKNVDCTYDVHMTYIWRTWFFAWIERTILNMHLYSNNDVFLWEIKQHGHFQQKKWRTREGGGKKLSDVIYGSPQRKKLASNIKGSSPRLHAKQASRPWCRMWQEIKVTAKQVTTKTVSFLLSLQN